MFIIHRFPFFGKRHFKKIRKLIGSCHFSHLWRCVIAIASLPKRKSQSKFTDLFGNHRTRQALAFFLTQSQWNAPELLLENALTVLRDLGWQSGETLYLILDDTQKEKRAKQMDAVSRIYLHSEKRYANGHTIVGAAFVYRGVVVPCAVRLWASKSYCTLSQKDNKHTPVEFKTLTELAADCINSVRLPSQGKMIVLFDKFYLCDTVVNACKEKGYDYIGAVKENRNFYPDGRPNDKKKLNRYGKRVLEREGKLTAISDAKKKHRLAAKVGNMSKLGRVKLAMSRRVGETSWILLATNNLKLSAKQCVEHYRNRWSIEVLFKMSKQHLGLGDYQFLRYTAVERYLHLVMISHHLLTRLARDCSSEKAQRTGRERLRLPSVPQMQATLRTMLTEDSIKAMGEGRKYNALAKKLKAMLVDNTKQNP